MFKRISSMLLACIFLITLTACSFEKPPKHIYIYEAPDPPETSVSENNPTSKPDINSIHQNQTPEDLGLEINDQYKDLYETNNDLVGWIKIPETTIDYPIVQTDNNVDYLSFDINKNENKKGAIFMDYKCDILSSDNKIIYGHNLLSGEGFAGICKYYPWLNDTKGSLNFYKQHPIIEYNNIYENKTSDYKIFAAIFATADISDPMYFNYHLKPNFNSEYEFYDYMADVMDRTVFYTDVDVKYGDEILTLSTCMYLLGKDYNTRFVIFARKLREHEDPTINTDNASINANPLYFDKYYKIMGGQWAGRNWPLSKITGYEEFLAQLER